MIALVGDTGFVGSNLYATGEIDAAYHTKNIREAYKTEPDLLIYAGVRAEKYLANSSPEKDRENIRQAQENIAEINPKKLVLISTIDVFKLPRGVDENSTVDTEDLHPYGYHRYLLETWVRENYKDALIIRLPGLFGKNMKKNFIYDYIHVIPVILRESKLEELAGREAEIRDFYQVWEKGFYKVDVSEQDKQKLKDIFDRLGFSAVNFTDSRSVYQFYHLANLWRDMQTALAAGLTLLHLSSEPVSAAELYQYLTGKQFVNELEAVPAYYDYRTIHAELFQGKNGYLYSKEQILREIKTFVEEEALW